MKSTKNNTRSNHESIPIRIDNIRQGLQNNVLFMKHRHFNNLGHTVFDPSRLPPDWEYNKYIRVCLKELTSCDAIYYVNDVTYK